MSLIIRNARMMAPGGPRVGWLLAEGGTIAALGTEEPPAADRVIEAAGHTLLPGFIDIHVHGAMGHETMDANADGLREMARFYATHGVTSFLATTWTASHARIMKALDAVAAVMGERGGAQLLGVHLEGPYLNPAKCGAQDAGLIRRANSGEVLDLLDTDVVRLVALAPEYPENHWLIDECVARGIRVAAAHTAATFTDMREAVRRGLSQTTHTFNAMSPLHHREPGVVGAALTMPELLCELIADNVHVHPAAMHLLLSARGVTNIALISDAVRGTGLAAGTTYLQDGREVTTRGGAAYLPDGTLAGSTLTMDVALRNFIGAVHRPLADVWPVTSRSAAQAFGWNKGSLEPGKDADLVLLDNALEVVLTVAGGEIVYERVS